MQIQENVLLAPYTTFKIGGAAKYFCVVRDEFDALQAYEFAKDKNLQTFVLGGGSNVLVSDNGFNGLVIKVQNSGIELASENHDKVILKVASGEVWDKVVAFSVTNNWWGIENLSHIPGSTGAIAVQNVGAYGQEAKNVVDSVTVFDRETGQIINLPNSECNFSYRSSIFNTTKKGRYIIFYIYFKLQKSGQPNLEYRDLQKKFAGSIPTLPEIRQAVTEIRDAKFPFPLESKNGNAGSFFKNPVLDLTSYESLKNVIGKNFNSQKVIDLENKKFMGSQNLKVPAAFLIELCELKNLEFGGAAINQNQPLVIINKSGQATAQDVLHLAKQVRDKVMAKTGIELIYEPELIGF